MSSDRTDGREDEDLVLRADHLSVVYDGESPTVAVRDVSLDLRRGEILGIAGESGCGKSTLAYALMRMLRPPARLTEGTIEFRQRAGAVPIDVGALDGRELRSFRWSRVSMVFQSAMNALNPVTSLRKQFGDVFKTHAPEMNADEREQRSRELLDMVNIDPARIGSFPHELSGGMRQRVAIAMALALRPEVVIMDEPTTALDVVVQREILDEIESLQEQLGFSIIFITHDLSLLLEISDRLAVMYAGRIVEYAPSVEVAQAPAHPYTLGLLQSSPELRGTRHKLHGIPGSPPSLHDELPGCSFAPRCDFAFGPCSGVFADLRRPFGAGPVDHRDDGPAGQWRVACHLHDTTHRPGGPPLALAGAGTTARSEAPAATTGLASGRHPGVGDDAGDAGGARPPQVQDTIEGEQK